MQPQDPVQVLRDDKAIQVLRDTLTGRQLQVIMRQDTPLARVLTGIQARGFLRGLLLGTLAGGSVLGVGTWLLCWWWR